MYRENVRKPILEKKNILIKEKERPISSTQGLFSKHLKRIYPIGLHRSISSLSLSSVSLSLSQNSNDSSLTDSSAVPLEQKISLALRLISPLERREVPAARNFLPQQQQQNQDSNDGELKRCNWITKNSGMMHQSS